MSNCVALVGRKVGMSSIYNADGHIVPITIVEVKKNVLLDIRTAEKDGYDAIVMAAFENNKKDAVNKPQVGLFKSKGVGLFQKIREFKSAFSMANFLPFVGKDCFVTKEMKGSFVDLQGVATGKGFQGPMKRWGFRGLRATHGVSVSHRSHGSTGNRTDPGKVFKGKRMAGRMGGGVVVQQSVQVLDVDVDGGLLFLKGSLPGKNGSILYIRDAVRKRGFGKVGSLNGFVEGAVASAPSAVVDGVNNGNGEVAAG